MPRFKGSERCTLTIKAPFARVVAEMTQPENIRKNLQDLERHERIDDQTYRWISRPMSEKGVRFHGDHTVRYHFDGKDHLTWETVGQGTLWSTGEARFAAEGEGATRVEYFQEVECEMEVSKLLAPVFRPIINHGVSKGIRAYLEAVKQSLER
jgi:carbon monoxide dehydrogenase subunit G